MPAKRYKLYTETHFARAITNQLSLGGVDVLRAEDAGMAGADDLEHLTFATAEGRIFVTADQDLLGIHARWQVEGREHGGIIFVQPEIREIGKRGIGIVVKALKFYHDAVQIGATTVEEQFYNQVTYISIQEWEAWRPS